MFSFLFVFFSLRECLQDEFNFSNLSIHLNKDSTTALEVIYYGSLICQATTEIKKKKTVTTEKPAKYAISN